MSNVGVYMSGDGWYYEAQKGKTCKVEKNKVHFLSFFAWKRVTNAGKKRFFVIKKANRDIGKLLRPVVGIWSRKLSKKESDFFFPFFGDNNTLLLPPLPPFCFAIPTINNQIILDIIIVIFARTICLSIARKPHLAFFLLEAAQQMLQFRPLDRFTPTSLFTPRTITLYVSIIHRIPSWIVPNWVKYEVKKIDVPLSKKFTGVFLHQLAYLTAHKCYLNVNSTFY